MVIKGVYEKYEEENKLTFEISEMEYFQK